MEKLHVYIFLFRLHIIAQDLPKKEEKNLLFRQYNNPLDGVLPTYIAKAGVSHNIFNQTEHS